MKLSLSLQASLLQTLTPQQIQYLKLLQLPVLQLEQHVRQEIEENPMLEELSDIDEFPDEDNEFGELVINEYAELSGYDDRESGVADDRVAQNDENVYLRESNDPFDFYESAWQDNVPSQSRNDDDDNDDGWQIKEIESFADELNAQLLLLPLDEDMLYIGRFIIGMLDDDGYLRIDTPELVAEINRIRDEEFDDILEDWRIQRAAALEKNETFDIPHPKKQQVITTEMTETMLGYIRRLDPPGIGARSVQECLLAQLEVIASPSEEQKLAIQILEKVYEAFTMKHYQTMLRRLNINEEQLRDALEVILRLNPKPGYGGATVGIGTIIPDFAARYDDDEQDILISINDNRIPSLKVNNLYERLKRDARARNYSKETKQWMRKKYDDAKFLLQAIRQRKITMMKVMTGIAGLQRDFFIEGPGAIKPLIYKDVADVTGLDISTVCRIVNGKFAQTDYGTFEMRYFFSEALPTDDGDEVSTRIVKQKIKELIDKEPKGKPYSDDKVTKELKKQGFNVARRTVAKYREQMRIPVARLRKEL
ncbi:RNA polymerase factor sigma-54 [Ignavibacteria bacterium]|nr:RNA polymerase factor sigma-54 [Bacteroidota bacterium]MCZ2133275.1 RNA polymerase factor sigma-54 [Bacteroidota bacterium]